MLWWRKFESDWRESILVASLELLPQNLPTRLA